MREQRGLAAVLRRHRRPVVGLRRRVAAVLSVLPMLLVRLLLVLLLVRGLRGGLPPAFLLRSGRLRSPPLVGGRLLPLLLVRLLLLVLLLVRRLRGRRPPALLLCRRLLALLLLLRRTPGILRGGRGPLLLRRTRLVGGLLLVLLLVRRLVLVLRRRPLLVLLRLVRLLASVLAIVGLPVLLTVLLLPMLLGGRLAPMLAIVGLPVRLTVLLLGGRRRRSPRRPLLLVPAGPAATAAPGTGQVRPAAQAEQIARLERLITNRAVQRHDTSPERTPARSSVVERCSMSPLRGIPM
ncbi:hypothetical protein [Actinomadura macrotermitis]|uniref:hypothetical protein n=1 Tax=Actinomadura macrotermitis TaxID=2585200 RepID=UPI0018869A85|nr:hypothetical protein [Actinomadura macrotermitis]